MAKGGAIPNDLVGERVEVEFWECKVVERNWLRDKTEFVLARTEAGTVRATFMRKAPAAWETPGLAKKGGEPGIKPEPFRGGDSQPPVVWVAVQVDETGKLVERPASQIRVLGTR